MNSSPLPVVCQALWIYRGFATHRAPMLPGHTLLQLQLLPVCIALGRNMYLPFRLQRPLPSTLLPPDITVAQSFASFTCSSHLLRESSLTILTATPLAFTTMLFPVTSLVPTPVTDN